ncbi:MAG: hypothetical protein JJ899_10885 [Alphaproteobacteria bacterium]|nr:hypothetical protein [Alphaproteobacteria bacterium]
MVPISQHSVPARNSIGEDAVEPLILADEAFSALERDCRAAEETIHLCYRIIDPEFPLLSEETDGAETSRWVDLLADRVRDGVHVRILMADFDEIVATGMHREARHRFEVFRKARETLSPEEQCRFEVICAQHPARIGAVAALAGWPTARRHLLEEIDRLNETIREDGPDKAREHLELTPEIARYVRFDEAHGRYENRFFPPHRVRPATHHEKLAVLDARVCFVGGIDVCDMTYDDAGHQNDPAWHDIGYRILGPAARSAEAYFRRRWTHAGGEEIGTLEEAKTGTASPVSLVATRSVDRRGPFAATPKPDVTDIRDRVFALASRARDFIYIENQFLRDVDLAHQIAQRARVVEGLQVVVVLPVVPIRSVEDGRIDEAAEHGLALQYEAIDILREAFADRLGVFTLARPEHAAGEGLDVVAGSKMVYVHSKLLIVDDRCAVAGSANFNGRSFYCDSELAFEWHSGDDIRALRLRLWRQVLGDPDGIETWPPGEFLQHWRGAAERNAARPPGDRAGFVVPYPGPEDRPAGRKHWLVPDMLV